METHRWDDCGMVTPYDKSKNLDMKRILASEAIGMVKNNITIGLGSGTTMQMFVEQISEKIKQEKLNLAFVPASKRIEQFAINHGLKLIEIDKVAQIDIAFDGADRIDANHNLIKGGGGSLFRERQVLEKANKKVIIADESKFVKDFTNEYIPIEIVPYNFNGTIEKIRNLGFHGEIRQNGDYFITDNGNYIVDVRKETPFDVETTYHDLKIISGVVDIGLFAYDSYEIINKKRKNR